MITLNFDGLCQPRNPGGVATFGFVVRNGDTIHNGRGLACPPFTSQCTNNYAEYSGLLRGLEWLIANGLAAEPIIVKGDSELVIKQVRGEYRMKSPNLIVLFTAIQQLVPKFKNIEFAWVPRELNAEADEQTNIAYREYHNSR